MRSSLEGSSLERVLKRLPVKTKYKLWVTSFTSGETVLLAARLNIDSSGVQLVTRAEENASEILRRANSWDSGYRFLRFPLFF